MPGEHGSYVWANAEEREERERLGKLEAWFDPFTVSHLETIGVGGGWRCLDVGAGGGSIARWLSERAGSTGTVVATDVDTRFLDRLPAHVEVRRHDVLSDDLEQSGFDIVHCRALLQNLADPRAALARMAGAVAPGGWLVIEEADGGLLNIGGFPAAARATSVLHDVYSRWVENGLTNVYYGRNVPELLYQLELEHFDARCETTVVTVGHPAFDVAKLGWSRARPAAAAVGVSDDDLCCVDAAFNAVSAVMVAPAFFAAWGRRRG